MSDGKKIAHAATNTQGNTVFLNDALKYLNDTYGDASSSVHFTVIFETTDDLLSCYEILKTDDKSPPFSETSYSKLVGNFKDKFGVLWGFMVTSS